MNNNSFVARVRRFQLSNGITLLVLENPTNPTVSMAGSMRAGEYFSPAGKDSLASITASMLGKGTRRRSKLEIAEELETAGARVGLSSNTFTASVSGLSLSRDLPMIVSTLAEELREPTFPGEELDKMRQRIIANIQEEQDDTRARAYDRMTQLVFPEGNPFHQTPAEKAIDQIEKITVDDIREFHQKFYGPSSMILAVVGDVKADDAYALFEEKLGKWRGAAESVIDILETPLQPTPIRETVMMKDKPNADVVIGHASRLRRSNPDFIAARIANNALGQSTLSSRLGLKVRDEMGLTYGINSSFAESGIGDGPFVITVTVAPENIDLAVGATVEIVDDYIANGIREDELKDEQSSIIGSFKIGLATNSGIAGQISAAELFGLGVKYLDDYPSLVAAVTKSDVDEAIRKYIHPEVATTVVAGTT
ncbi:MAG TPA: pitrilysin family protein [Blastocatellia bacterium]|jgi:zinc protease|nr:pitrilysin family protein [Blastocatellia bacterium]